MACACSSRKINDAPAAADNDGVLMLHGCMAHVACCMLPLLDVASSVKVQSDNRRCTRRKLQTLLGGVEGSAREEVLTSS